MASDLDRGIHARVRLRTRRDPTETESTGRHREPSVGSGTGDQGVAAAVGIETGGDGSQCGRGASTRVHTDPYSALALSLAMALLSSCVGESSVDAGRDSSTFGETDGATTQTPPDGSGSVDVTTIDSFHLDAWRSDECNGDDDDGDGVIDETPTDCGDVPNPGDALCLGGVCVCRNPAGTAHAGARADCNADRADGCETPLDTSENCGDCGVRCDLLSRCTDSPTDGLACRPVGIVDFSVARPGGEITCIVTVDRELICRGPNTDFAITEAEPETAVLDWTRVDDMPEVLWVRTWSRVRDDGVEVLTICGNWPESGDWAERVFCRGDRESPWIRPRYTGPGIVAAGGPIFEMGILNGVGYQLVRGGGVLRLFRRDPPAVLVFSIRQMQIVDMPIVESDFGGLLTFGPHTGLAGVPATTPGWSEPTRAPLAGQWIDCRGSYCCDPSVSRNGIHCWRGVDGVFSEGTRQVPEGVVTPDHDLTALQLAQVGDAAPLACVRVGAEDDDPDTEAPRVYCAPVDEIVERGADTTLTERPDLVSASGRGPRSRWDWQAMCVIERPDYWRCEGSHTGWGAP